MTEKQIRCNQLEELKSGIFSATFYTEVVSFDGRTICRNAFDNIADCIAAYERYKKEWARSAHVRRFAAFDF